MEIKRVHPLNVGPEMFETIQNRLSGKISLKNNFSHGNIRHCAGVDVVYWKKEDVEWGACSIIVINYETKKPVEKACSIEKTTFPYVQVIWRSGNYRLSRQPKGYQAYRIFLCLTEMDIYIPVIWELRHMPPFS